MPPSRCECLLRWPARLEEISLELLFEPQHNVHGIQLLLSIHQMMLRKITLDQIRPHGRIPGFFTFPCLEELNVWLSTSVGNSENCETPLTAYQKLTMPSLRRVEMRLGFITQYLLKWMDSFLDLVRQENKGSTLSETFLVNIDIRCSSCSLTLVLTWRSSDCHPLWRGPSLS